MMGACAVASASWPIEMSLPISPLMDGGAIVGNRIVFRRAPCCSRPGPALRLAGTGLVLPSNFGGLGLAPGRADEGPYPRHDSAPAGFGLLIYVASVAMQVRAETHRLGPKPRLLAAGAACERRKEQEDPANCRKPSPTFGGWCRQHWPPTSVLDPRRGPKAPLRAWRGTAQGSDQAGARSAAERRRVVRREYVDFRRRGGRPRRCRGNRCLDGDRCGRLHRRWPSARPAQLTLANGHHRGWRNNRWFWLQAMAMRF